MASKHKCVYGLSDASRHWYLRLREELLKLKAIPSLLDHGIFFWFTDGELIGVMVVFVDDLLWAGTKSFEMYVIIPLQTTFSFGPESSKAFVYIGIELNQDLHYITISQKSYINTIKSIPIEKLSEKHSPISEQERKLYRGAIGQLNWVAGISHPEISFDVCVASTKVKSATKNDLITINKTIQQIKSAPSSIRYPILDIESLYLRTYTDASFNNLPNGGSQGGHITFFM